MISPQLAGQLLPVAEAKAAEGLADLHPEQRARLAAVRARLRERLDAGMHPGLAVVHQLLEIGCEPGEACAIAREFMGGGFAAYCKTLAA